MTRARTINRPKAPPAGPPNEPPTANGAADSEAEPERDDREPIPIPKHALTAIRVAIVAAQDAADARDALIRGVMLGLGVDPSQPWDVDPRGWIRPIKPPAVPGEAEVTETG